MIKIFIRCKRYWPIMILLCVLLYGQVQLELALPTSMSNLVNNGIQGKGIPDSLPDVLREESVADLFNWMEEKDQKEFQNCYQLVEPKSASEEMKLQYPALKGESVYVKNSNLDPERQADLNDSVSNAMIINAALMQNLSDQERAEFQSFLSMMDDQKKKEVISQIKEQMSDLGESTVQSMTKQLILNEYEAIGMDLDKIQMDYLYSSGKEMLLLCFGIMMIAVVVGFLSARMSSGISRGLRSEVFEKVETFSQAEFDRFSTASLITRTTNDVQQVQMVIIMVFRIVVYAPLMGFGALIKVLNTNLSMSWIIGLIIALCLSLIGVAFVFVLPKFKVIQSLIDKMNLVMRENLNGLLVIRAFNTQKHEEERFDRASKDIRDTNLFINKAMVSLMPIMNLILNCGTLLIVWAGAWQLDLGNLMIGEMMAFIQYSMQVIMSFLMIAMVAIMLPRAAVAADRILEVLETEPVICDPNSIQEFDESKKGTVEFRNVSFRYPGAENDVLHNITFTALPMQTTAFIGSTGSGKSTIMNLLLRFFDVNEGEILLDGVNIKEVSQKDLRDKIGYVPQKGVLFQGTITSNIQTGKEEASEDEIKEAVEIAQAKEFVEDKPNGYEEPIAQGGTNVSGGQKQRLSIARALVRKAEVFIFDDSFSALDFKTDAALRKSLNEMIQKTKSTVLIVGQRIASIMDADQIIVLDQGEIVGIGTHQQLMESCEVYKQIATSQLSKEELGNE